MQQESTALLAPSQLPPSCGSVESVCADKAHHKLSRGCPGTPERPAKVTVLAGFVLPPSVEYYIEMCVIRLQMQGGHWRMGDQWSVLID